MALTGIDIFKVTPKKNCKDCGCPTCMAFAMKVAQGALPLDKCPHLDDAVKAKLSDATAPPMKTIKVGKDEIQLGGETVMFRHEKTFVSRTIYAATVCDCCDDAKNEEVLASVPKIDYERIGERMIVEGIFVNHSQDVDAAKYVELVKKAAALDRLVILNCADADVAKQALEVVKGTKPILMGADAANYEAMNALAKEYDATLGVKGANLDELHDTVEKIEALGNKNLVLEVSTNSIKEAFADAVQIRRAAIKGEDRTFGYPSVVNVGALAAGDTQMQTALATLFTLKYDSVVVMESMNYAQALPLYGLRQNIFTDPQKPMRVEPGIYPLNDPDENSLCCLTVDFALSYFVASGEMERSGVPINLLIPDAGGYSVLTAWAAGKLSAEELLSLVKLLYSKANWKKNSLAGKSSLDLTKLCRSLSS